MMTGSALADKEANHVVSLREDFNDNCMTVGHRFGSLILNDGILDYYYAEREVNKIVSCINDLKKDIQRRNVKNVLRKFTPSIM